ncbi:MAG TPA: FtsX-like permease family protein [Prolixibacteraceae bacterium]|nr:FtsX-like permease family protein [Prolixibacteraceae bacterium]
MLSKSSKNVVNIISGVALLGVIVGTTALVVVISIFNGFDVLIKSFYSYFDPQMKITTVEGKQFNPNNDDFTALKADPSVIHYCEVIEEIALLRFEERQFIAYIKGVDENYLEMGQINKIMYDGDLMLNDGNFDYTVIGRGVAYNLGAAVNFIRPISISVPRKGRSSSTLLNPFKQKHLFLSGVYSVEQQEVDDQFAIVSISVARELLDMDTNVTSIELGLKPGTDERRFQKQLQKKMGPSFKIENRYQQHEQYYRVAKNERFFIFLTLSFILVIASFNLASSISMLILDKKRDINILLSLGMTRKKIGMVFLYEGWLISTIGAVIGLVLGILICLGQIHFGWIEFPGSFAIETYPVELRFVSLLIIAITVLLIGGIASWLPVKFLPNKFFQLQND